MRPTPVHRFHFSIDEVIAAIFPSGIPAQGREMRVEGDELIIDFVNPKIDPLHSGPAVDGEQLSHNHDDDLDGDRTVSDGAKPAKLGPVAEEASELCKERGFQTFLEVKTEEAAVKILFDRLRITHWGDIDTNKYKKAEFRDLVGEYQVWLRG